METTNPMTTGEKITRIRIDHFMAMTHRTEMTMSEAYPAVKIGGYGNRTLTYGEGKVRGKRKAVYVQAESNDAIWLRGWDLPIQADTDTHCTIDAPSTIRGNACFNLCGDAQTIRRLLATAAIVPLTDEQKGICILCAADPDNDVPLYPEIQTSHAVIQRMKEGGAA